MKKYTLHFFCMAADTGDNKIIACETLIFGNLLYSKYYTKLSHITQHAKKKKKVTLQMAE